MGFSGSCETTLIAGIANDAMGVEKGIQSQLCIWQQGSSQGRRQGCQPLKALRNSARLFQGEQGSNRRRAIVAITDDRAGGTAGDLVRNGVHDLWNASAVVLSLNLKNGLKEFHTGAYRGARYAAERTGGEAVEFDDVSEGIRDAIRRLRSGYILYYALPSGKPGEERSIRVELAGPAGNLHKKGCDPITGRARNAHRPGQRGSIDRAKRVVFANQMDVTSANRGGDSLRIGLGVTLTDGQ